MHPNSIIPITVTLRKYVDTLNPNGMDRFIHTRVASLTHSPAKSPEIFLFRERLEQILNKSQQLASESQQAVLDTSRK